MENKLYVIREMIPAGACQWPVAGKTAQGFNSSPLKERGNRSFARLIT